jgi:hypothetical protein
MVSSLTKDGGSCPVMIVIVRRMRKDLSIGVADKGVLPRVQAQGQCPL